MILVAACSGSKNDPAPKDLTGKWTFSSMPISGEISIVKASDGSLVVDQVGTFTIDGDTFTNQQSTKLVIDGLRINVQSDIRLSGGKASIIFEHVSYSSDLTTITAEDAVYEKNCPCASDASISNLKLTRK